MQEANVNFIWHIQSKALSLRKQIILSFQLKIVKSISLRKILRNAINER